MKITTTIAGQDPRRLIDLIERRIRERIAAGSATARPRVDDDAAPPIPRAPRDTTRS